MPVFYAVYHGPEQLRTIATRVHSLTHFAAQRLQSTGFELAHQNFFDTVSVLVENAESIVNAAAKEFGLNLRLIDANRVGFSFDETTNGEDVILLLSAFGIDTQDIYSGLSGEVLTSSVPAELIRQSEFLTHPVFHRYHSETEMLRYLKRLENKDFSLTHGMIPLGSCTMKLNATAEMIPVTFNGLSLIHI